MLINIIYSKMFKLELSKLAKKKKKLNDEFVNFFIIS